MGTSKLMCPQLRPLENMEIAQQLVILLIPIMFGIALFCIAVFSDQ